ncbi:thiol:disulfide interchange protein DsbA/DsbL [Pokkaliibacter sp. CJK22405]|uniref:thiol:disulfide interchange protein DsbA/DsbL n=1 Tax=Pokkaliibacter sp. CJK22405 TaxID=3384615 RepID=UPI0039853329
MLKAVKVLVLGLCLLPLAGMADETYVEGKDYQVLSEPVHTPDPKKIQVIEFFSYACPHCNAFDPVVTPWAAKLGDDVQFDHVPVVFHPSWEGLARTYYATHEVGVEEKIHAPLFAAIHQDHRNLSTKENLVAFMKEQNVDAEQFAKVYSSFATDMRLKKGEGLLASYEVTGVPSITINGKYVVAPVNSGEDTFTHMLKVADYLIAKERKAMQ